MVLLPHATRHSTKSPTWLHSGPCFQVHRFLTMKLFPPSPWGEPWCRGPRLYALLVQYRFHILAFSLVEGFSEKEEPITLKSGPCSYYCASWLSISFSPVSGYILSTCLVLPPPPPPNPSDTTKSERRESEMLRTPRAGIGARAALFR